MTSHPAVRATWCAFMLSTVACTPPDDRAPPARPPGTIALGERIAVPSSILGAHRTALVNLPDGYRTDGGGYPVIVVLDGEANFLTAVSASRFLARAGLIPDAIIVGLENTARERDFTTVATHPEAVPKGLGQTGGAAAFGAFIESELMPMLDDRYNTVPARVLVGHSLGGLLAMHMLAAKPAVFRGYVTLEPSLWWDRRAVADSVRRTLAASPALQGRLVMVERGSTDGWIPDSAGLRQAAGPGFELFSVALDDVSHEMLPYQGFHDGLRRLFEGYEPGAATDPDMATMPALERQYRRLSTVFGYDMPIPEAAFLAAASRRMDARAAGDAVALLERGVQVHPRSRRLAAALEAARAQVAAPAAVVRVPFRPVTADQAARLVGDWVEQQAAQGQAPAMRVEHRFELRSDTLMHVARVIPGPGGPPPFGVAAMPVRIAGDTVRWERFNRGGGGYVTELRFEGRDVLAGVETGIGLPEPPPGVENRPTPVRLVRAR